MKTKIDYSVAFDIASKVRDRLLNNCERVEFAGSLRRMKSQVGDIEMMIVPNAATYTYLDYLLEQGKIRHTTPKRWGDKLRSFMMMTTGSHPLDLQFDLFLQPDPATWGANMVIRTGCSEFSQRMVTQRSKGGWCPDCYLVKNARVWDIATGEALDTPEEKDVFRLWGMEVPAPEERTETFVPMWAEVEYERPTPQRIEFNQPVQNMGKLTMERAEQIIEESKLWPSPLVGHAAAKRMAADAIAKSMAQGKLL